MKIGKLDTDEKIVVIAEIGNNHEGSEVLAAQMVHEAAEAGADAVKFQCIDPEHLADSPERLAQLKSICLTWVAFKFLRHEANRLGLEFLCTPFNVEAVEFLDPLVPAWKIAARSFDNDELLWAVARTGKPVLQSCPRGWPSYREIVRDRPWMELHVVPEYPCPPEHADLLRLREFTNFQPSGYSDHTIGIDACVGAAFLGARVIEKHFTTEAAMNADNEYKSNDHVHSVIPDEFAEMVDRIRKAEVLCSRPDSSSA